jgi:nucleoside triphosphate diphosphatase
MQPPTAPPENPFLHAMSVSQDAAALGFDWPAPQDVIAKAHEELQELSEAIAAHPPDPAHVQEELGDLLFALTNLARLLHLDPSQTLSLATQKFSRRFTHVQRLIDAHRAASLPPPSLAEMEAAWQAAKRLDPPLPDAPSPNT